MVVSNQSIIVVGGGVFGTAAAHELIKRGGWKTIRVFDRYAPPSKISAGTDINKIVRTDYPEHLYTKMGAESMKEWTNPNGIFGGLYTHTGWILSAYEGSTEWIEKSVETAAELGLEIPKHVTSQEITTAWPELNGNMKDWKSYHNANAGWVNSREALHRLARSAASAGVEYTSGAAGHVLHLVFDENGKCIGIRCQDGRSHYADLILLAAGAATPTLLDTKGQIISTGHCVGHIQLTPEEVEKYSHMPIINNLQGGLIFPPIMPEGIMKIAASHFVTNYSPTQGRVSLPRYRVDNPGDGLPQPIEKQLRKFIKEIIPELADRVWFETNLCWDADTPDYHFLIDAHPEHDGLYVATGGSSHSFKFFPVLGGYIADMIEGKPDPEAYSMWKWRPGQSPSFDSGDPHPTLLIDLIDVPGFGRPQVSARL